MSDHGKPIDTLPTKNASELNLLDTLLGVAAGGDPAAFQTPLGQLAESESFLDALAGGLISRIIGPAQSNDDGSFIRLENGWQVCWHTLTPDSLAGGAQASGVWTFPAPFVELPVVIPGASSHSVSSDLWGQRVVTTSYNSSLVPEGAERQIHWTVRDTRSSGSAGGLRVHMLAVGKWK